MRIDSLTAVQTQSFGEEFLRRIGANPFGTLSKSEIDLAVFSALVDSGVLDVDSPVFDLARKLECTPAKVNSLAFAYRLRDDTAAEGDAIAEAVKVVKVEGSDVVLNVESRYWREALIAKLKAAGVFTDTSFNREKVTMDLAAFTDHFDAVFGSGEAELRRDLDTAAVGATNDAEATTKRGQRLAGLIKEAAKSAVETVTEITVKTLISHLTGAQ